MKRKLTLLSILLSYLCFNFPARASHFIGGEIGYSSIAPGIIIAEFKAYYDCNAAAPVPTMPVTIKSPGCSNGLTATANRQMAYQRNLNPYCPAMGNSCGGSSGKMNWLEAKYLATITLPAQCSEWILSFQDCSKPPVTNLVSPGPNCFHLEAYINMTVSQPVSPQFYSMPTYLVTVNSSATILNLAAKRGTEDSIAYSLKPALTDLNLPAVYKPNFTYTNFIPSATGVQLDFQTGLLTFTPNVYNQVAGYDANAYTFVVEATGYKKLNGVMTKISSTQRNMQVLVENMVPNQNPDITNVIANGNPVQPNDIIQVKAGDPLVLQFQTTDANASDSVYVELHDPNNPVMPWSIFYSGSGGAKPTGTFTWHTNNATPGDFYYFPITVKDNFCPLRGITTRMFGVKVIPRTTGVEKETTSDVLFSVYPNPFSESVTFNITGNGKVKRIAIYNLLGQKIDELKVNLNSTNKHQVTWPNASGNPPGTYVAKLISDTKSVQTIKFTKLQ